MFEIWCHACGRESADNVPITNDKDYIFEVNCHECKYHLLTFRGGLVEDE